MLKPPKRLIKRLSQAALRALGLEIATPPKLSPPTLKTLLIEEAAIARGYATRRLNNVVVIVEIAGRSIPFRHMNGPASSAVGQELCDEKHLARELLRAEGIEVAESQLMSLHELAAAVSFAQTVGYPVVIKPTNSSRGHGVTTNITTDEGLRQAIITAGGRTRRVLIEKHFFGEDFRFFVVDGRVISVTHRVRANLVGDGIRPIRELIAAKNRERQQNRYLCNCLIPTEERLLTRMVRDGYTLDSVPREGKTVTLRDQSNLSAGGDSVDVTDICHPAYKELAIRAVGAIPGMRYAGLDLLTKDVTREPAPHDYIVGEIEFSPAPLAHYPVVGKPRDMAGAILDFYERLARQEGASLLG